MRGTRRLRARPGPDAGARPRRPPQVYARVTDEASLVPLFESYLEDYNATAPSPMRLVMFLDAIEHVSRLCRRARGGAGRAFGVRAARAVCARAGVRGGCEGA